MRKIGLFFQITSVVWGIAVLALILVFSEAWFFILCVGVGVWGIWVVCFRSISYSVEGGILRITSGFLFRRERTLPLSEILMTTSFHLCGRLLFTIGYFSGGRIILFAEIPENSPDWKSGDEVSP